MSSDRYREVQADAAESGSWVKAHRDEPFTVDFELEDGSKKTFKFRRLRASEWNAVVGLLNAVGLEDPAKASKEQLDKLLYAECLALGYANLDGYQGNWWLNQDDKLIIELCYAKLMHASQLSKEAYESLGWFRQQPRRTDISETLPSDGKVP